MCWAVVRVGAYRVWKGITGRRDPPIRPQFAIVCVGLGGAGKSRMLASAMGDEGEVVPTAGFAIKALALRTLVFNVKELGGADRWRKYWDRYYAGAEGLVWVLDATGDVDGSLEALEGVAAHPELRECPVLVLATRADLVDAAALQARVEAITAVGTGRHFHFAAVDATKQPAVLEALAHFSSFYYSTDDM